MCRQLQFTTIMPKALLMALAIMDSIHQNTAHRMTVQNVSVVSSQSHERELQLGTGILDRYQVGESTIDFQGTQVKFVYPLSDLVPDNSVVITTYSDFDCTADITDNNYLTPVVTYDDNPNPTGEKNREVTVTYTIEPNEITDEDVWIDNGEGTVFLSFCTAINLYTGDISDPGSGPYTRLDTVVNLQVEFTDGWNEKLPVGPNDVRKENAQEIYLVEGFICDGSNTLLNSEEPMVQGQKVRICVKPTNEALADGIRMRRIDSFTFYRYGEDENQITQVALRDGKSANDELTELTCERGSTICWFETLLKADFYYKAGMILGYGEAWLQFGSGSSRRLETNNRKLVDVSGGFANTATIELSFFGVPGGNEYLAEAYHCDQYDRRLDPPPALVVGQSARICVAPTEEGRDVGIRIHSIDSFSFSRSRETQDAVLDNTGTPDGQSVVVCKPNSKVCAFRTIFQNSFFTSDGLVGSDGMVTLQYSQNSAYAARRLKEQRNIAAAAPRELQSDVPLFYAGESSVSVDTLVLYQRDDTLNPCAFEHKFTEWWIEEPIEDRYRYIAILAIAGATLALCLFCCWCIPPCFFSRRRKKIEDGGNDVHVNVEVKKETESTNVVESTPDVVPGENDVVFGDKSRPMTAKFLKHVRSVAQDHQMKEFSPSVYKACKKPFEDCGFFHMDVEGKYRRLGGEETVAMIGKAFVEAKMQHEGLVRSSSCADITQNTFASSVSSGRTRQLRRINSSGSLMVFPTENDIVLGDPNHDHPGTRSFLRHVRRVARENNDEEFNATIYREIKKEINGNGLFVVRNDGTYRNPKKTEICALVAEAYEEAKMANSRSVCPSMRTTIEVDHQSQDDMSSIGESLCRPWSENDQSTQKSRKSKRLARNDPTASIHSTVASSKRSSHSRSKPSPHQRSRSLTDLNDIMEDHDIISSDSRRSKPQVRSVHSDEDTKSVKSKRSSTRSLRESSSSHSTGSRNSGSDDDIESMKSKRSRSSRRSMSLRELKSSDSTGSRKSRSKSRSRRSRD